MPTIEFSFLVTLEESIHSGFNRHVGPHFNRWLPDGESDSISLVTNDKGSTLKVWFERKGFVDSSGLIVFDEDKNEVDPSVMERQAILDAGPINGNLIVSNVTETEFIALIENKIGDQEYIKLGKRVIDLISSPISNFIDILRINFGQYWLKDFNSWDSRYQSLGAYCSNLRMKWRPQTSKTWQSFRPTKLEVKITASRIDDSQFLTKEDFLELSGYIKAGYAPTQAASILAHSHQIQNSDT